MCFVCKSIKDAICGMFVQWLNQLYMCHFTDEPHNLELTRDLEKQKKKQQKRQK
jgi:hypothetical protein